MVREQSRTRLLVSLLLVWHLTAITIGSVKSPELAYQNVEPREIAPSSFASMLDAVASGLHTCHEIFWRVTAPIRPAVDAYIKMTRLQQPWTMFSNPPQYDEYLRVRYYIGRDSARPTRVVTELVMPAGREDRPRWVRGYRESFKDKAHATALERFFSRRGGRVMGPGTRPEALPDDLAPIGRYYARRFGKRELSPEERIFRVELWHGIAPMPPPGAERHEPQRLARLAALLAYYEEPIEDRLRIPPVPPYHALEREADIRWLLEYFEEP